MANAILVSGLIFLFGLALSKILEKFKLPAVTSYLIAGVIIGPYVLNLVPAKLINLTTLVANVILSIVAFSLGRTFTRRQIETIGRAVMLISWGRFLGLSSWYQPFSISRECPSTRPYSSGGSRLPPRRPPR